MDRRTRGYHATEEQFEQSRAEQDARWRKVRAKLKEFGLRDIVKADDGFDGEVSGIDAARGTITIRSQGPRKIARDYNVLAVTLVRKA